MVDIEISIARSTTAFAAFKPPSPTAQRVASTTCWGCSSTHVFASPYIDSTPRPTSSSEYPGRNVLICSIHLSRFIPPLLTPSTTAPKRFESASWYQTSCSFGLIASMTSLLSGPLSLSPDFFKNPGRSVLANSSMTTSGVFDIDGSIRYARSICPL